MRFLCYLILALVVLWSLGFAFFLFALPSRPTLPTVTTDAIVVLTGGQARVERGFEMLAEGAAPVLFISGVGAEVTLPQMLAAHATPEQRVQIKARGATIILGHLASTTETNAQEVAEFVRERQLKSIRLITAHYHMPRSLLEFRSLLPKVTVVPDAAFPSDSPREHWWYDEKSRRLILSEYHKYLAARLRLLVFPGA